MTGAYLQDAPKVRSTRPSEQGGEDVKLLQAIANQAAITIEHTTLIEKFHEMREALAVRDLMEWAEDYLMCS